MTPSPPTRPVVSLYSVLSTEHAPEAEQAQLNFGFHDTWPDDIGPDEWIQVDLSDGSSRIVSNAVGHMMLLGQLQTLAGQRPDLTFTAWRCKPIEAP